MFFTPGGESEKRTDIWGINERSKERVKNWKKKGADERGEAWSDAVSSDKAIRWCCTDADRRQGAIEELASPSAWLAPMTGQNSLSTSR